MWRPAHCAAYVASRNGVRSTFTTSLPRLLNSAPSLFSISTICAVARAAASLSTSVEDLLVGVRQLVPGRPSDDGQQRVGDVAGQHDVLLHFVELLRIDRRQRVFLRVDRPILQSQVDLGEGDRRGIRADGAREHRIQRRVGHADLQSLHVLGLVDRLVRRDLAFAVIGDGDDLVAAALGAVALGTARRTVGSSRTPSSG